MQTNVFWVPGPWPGRLGIVPRPRGGDWLADETKSWRQAGIDRVISLLERDEEGHLDLEGEAEAAAASGVEFTSFPIPDRGIPASGDSAAELVSGVVDALERGRTVAVHCRQGIGRSALITGAVLVAEGQDVFTALRTIKESRGLDVPETAEQRQWLSKFASRLTREPAAHHHAAPDGRQKGVIGRG